MGHVHYVNNVAFVRLILTFVFLIISSTGSAGSERDKYESKDKKPIYNFVKSSYSDNYEATEKAENGETDIDGRAQQVENGIIGCATVLSNFCMRD